MYTIIIKDILKGRTYPEAGVVLYDNIVNKVNIEDKIVLDMSDIDTLPSMFLNTSIGKFIDDYGFSKLKEMVSFSNINAAQASRIKDYVLKVAGN